MFAALSIWIKLAILAAILSSVAGGYWYIKHTGVVEGRAEVQATFDAYKAAVVVANNKAEAQRTIENKAIKDKSDLAIAQSKKDNENEITKIRAYYATNLANQLRVSRSICNSSVSPVPAKGDSTSGGDATLAGTVALPDAISRNLQDLAKQCDEQSAGYRTLQNFIKSQGMAP